MLHPPLIAGDPHPIQKRAWRAEFNAEYYRSTYADFSGLSIDLFQNFITFGWREDRNPRAGFDMALYKREVREKHSNAHPMRDLRRLGTAARAARSAVTLLENRADTGKAAFPLRLGVHFHAFYPEIIGEFLPSVHFFRRTRSLWSPPAGSLIPPSSSVWFNMNLQAPISPRVLPSAPSRTVEGYWAIPYRQP